jgi:hypothetical protein
VTRRQDAGRVRADDVEQPDEPDGQRGRAGGKAEVVDIAGAPDQR